MNFKDWIELNEGSAGTTFKTWYDYHRGKWSDVENLAKRSPKLRAFLNRIEDEVQYGQFDKFANPLQRQVSKFIPNHAKWELDPAKRQQDLENQGRSPRQGQVPSGTTGSMAAGSQSNDGPMTWAARKPGQPPHPQQQAYQPNQQSNPTMTIQNHEERLAALERLFKQFQNGQYQRQTSV